MPDSMAARALAAILAAAAVLAAGYFWGDAARDNAWQAKEAKRLKAEGDARESELRRSDKASGELQAQLLAQQIRSDQLQGAFNAYKRQHPILARPATAAVATAPAGSSSGKPQPPPVVGGDPALSLGAVWMWNSALAGQDAPVGACGLADTSEAACAADSGVSLTAAWDNQALNARLCAEDRLRHQRLIDYIQEGKQWTPNSK